MRAQTKPKATGKDATGKMKPSLTKVEGEEFHDLSDDEESKKMKRKGSKPKDDTATKAHVPVPQDDDHEVDEKKDGDVLIQNDEAKDSEAPGKEAKTEEEDIETPN